MQALKLTSIEPPSCTKEDAGLMNSNGSSGTGLPSSAA